MMTFECMLTYMHPATRMASLHADDSGKVTVTHVDGTLTDDDRKTIERYSKEHCERMNHPFTGVDFDGDTFGEPADIDAKLDLDRPDRFEIW